MSLKTRMQVASVTRLWLLWAAACFCIAGPAFAQTGDNVAVVINENSPASKRVGEYYASKRRVPPSNVIRIRTADAETITRPAFDSTIHAPIAAAIARSRLHDRVLYLVLTKGVPLRIQGTAGLEGTMASVDSELTLLYRRTAAQTVPLRGSVDNPYFLGKGTLRDARPFTHREHDIFLVTRLDAFTVDEAIRLVDRALEPVTDGRIVLDQRDAITDRTGEDWLEAAANQLSAAGHSGRVILEKTPKPVRDVPQVLGYYGWGSVDPENRVRTLRMGFVPGSLATTFASASARTFQEPPKAWVPTGDLRNQSGWYGGAPHSLVGDLIREGATGVSGAVAEPYLRSVVRPDILFNAYLAGFNLAEAFYLALPSLSWHSVIIGDPLCTPFPRKAPPAEDLSPELDARTELPKFHSARRLEASAQIVKTKPEALAALIKAEGRLAREQPEAARAAFEEVLTLDDSLVGVHLQIAAIDEQAGRRDAATERYKRIVALQPNNVLALNNLAYNLAVHDKRPADAKPYAQKAVAAAPRNPAILDTLGWIEHLLGNNETAVKLLSTAARLAPKSAEIRLHTAFAVEAAGAPGAAAAELKSALELDPSLADRADVKELQSRLRSASK